MPSQRYRSVEPEMPAAAVEKKEPEFFKFSEQEHHVREVKKL